MNATTVAAGEWAQRARELEKDGWRLTDLCGVDRMGFGGDPRFTVVCQLLNMETKQRQSVTIEVPGEPPTMPSVVETWPVADFMEREAFDMFGIVFEGHPNLKRILMPDEWEGYPLRKDYGVGKVPVEFIPQPFLQIDAPGQAPDGFGAGTGVDKLGQSGAPDRSTDNGSESPRERA